MAIPKLCIVGITLPCPLNLIDRYGQHLKSVSTLQCYGEELSAHIAENSVDFVVCTYVLCSVVDVEAVLRNIHHVLKPVSYMHNEVGSCNGKKPKLHGQFDYVNQYMNTQPHHHRIKAKLQHA